MKTFLLLTCSCLLFLPAVALHAQVATSSTSEGELIKGSQPTVYFSYRNKRFAFPNEKIFFSWYPDFSNVKIISDSELALKPLIGNVTYNSPQLVKITTDPKVYVVLNGNVLQWVTTEQLAITIFGDKWSTLVKDLSDTEFQDYVVMSPIMSTDDYPSSTIRTDKTLQSSLMTSELHLEEDGSSKNFPIPPNSGHLEITKYGFAATTTSFLPDITTWFKSKISGTTLYDNDYSTTTAGATVTMKMMNIGTPDAGSFKHRSWLYANGQLKPTDPIEREILYSDITFPKGFISYPRAVNYNDYYHSTINDYTSYHFITQDSISDIFSWYATNGPLHGWNITASTTATTPSRSSTEMTLLLSELDSITLENPQQHLKLSVIVNDSVPYRSATIDAGPISY